LIRSCSVSGVSFACTGTRSWARIGPLSTPRSTRWTVAPLSVTPAFLDRFPEAIVNVHPSLLPSFPGARAVEEQLAAGVTESGATVHIVDEGVDSGPILAQERVPVLEGDTPETLHERIKQVEHELLPKVVRELCAR